MSLPTFAQIAGHEPREVSSVPTWLAGAAIVFAGIAPLVWMPWQKPFDLPKLFFIALAFVCASLSLFLHHREVPVRFPLPKGAVMALGSLLLTGATSIGVSSDWWQGIFGNDGTGSTSGIVMLMSVIGAMLGAFFVLGQRRVLSQARLFGDGVFFIAGLITLFQYLGWFSFGPAGVAERLFSPIGGGLFWAWIACFRWVVPRASEEASMPSRVVDGVARGFALVSLLLLDQGLPLAVALVWSVVALVRSWKHITIPARFVQGLAMLALGAALVLPIPKPNALPVVAELSWSASVRLVGEALRAHPLMGVGPGQWSLLVEKHRTVDMNQGGLYALSFDTASSWFLTVLAEYGAIFGVVTLMGLGVLLGRITLVHPRRIAAASVGVLALLAAPLPAWMVVGVWMMLGGMAATPKDASERLQTMLRWWYIKVAVVAICLLGVLVWQMRIESLITRSAQAVNVQEAKTLAEQAFTHAPRDRRAMQALVQTQAVLVTESLQASRSSYSQEAAQALLWSKQSVEQWPQDAQLWLLQGALYRSLMSTVQSADQFAIRAFQEGLVHAPKHPGLLSGVGSVYAWRAENGGVTSSTQALAAYRAEQHRLAAQWFSRALAVKPDDEAVAYAFAVQAAKAGDGAAALPVMRQLYERAPHRTDIRLEYAALLAMTGQRTQAISLLEKVSSQDALFVQATRLLADWYEQEQQYASAAAALKRLPEASKPTPAFTKRLKEVELKAKVLR